MNDNDWLCTPQEAEARKERKDLYKQLREQNEALNARRCQKRGGDFFDDDDDDDRPPPGKDMRPGDIKKHVTSCINKLQELNRDTKASVLKALEDVGARLDRFLDSAANNLMKCKLTMKDIVAFVEVASRMHQYYRGFSEMLFERMVEAVKESDPTHLRTWLAVLGDLVLTRVFAMPEAGHRPTAQHLGVEATKIFASKISICLKTDASGTKFENWDLIWRILRYSGGDIFGMKSETQPSIMDPVFPGEGIAARMLADGIKEYFIKCNKVRKDIALEVPELLKTAETLRLQKGFTTTKEGQKAKELRIEYDRLTEIAKRLGFIMKKPVEAYLEEQPKVEASAPVAASPELPGLPVEEAPDDFYTNLPDMNETTEVDMTVEDICRALTQVATAVACDELALAYVKIDSPEHREALIAQIDHLPPKLLDKAKYYARFVACVSQKYPEIGEVIVSTLKNSFIAYLTRVRKSPRLNVVTRFTVGRYLGELALFNLAIDAVAECIFHGLDHFDSRFVDVLGVLIFVAGKHLNSYSDTSHKQSRVVLEKLKAVRDKAQFDQAVAMTLTHAINVFEPPPEKVGDVIAPPFSKYQAYARHVFWHTETSSMPARLKKTAEKLISVKSTNVDMQFLINLTLSLTEYRVDSYSGLAKFTADFSRSFPEFGRAVTDILLERIRKGVEVPKRAYHQSQLTEVLFLAELANVRLVPFETICSTAALILGYEAEDPRKHQIQITWAKGKAGSSRKPKMTVRDGFRVKCVCELFSKVTPILREEPQYQNLIIPYLAWLQAFIFIRDLVPLESHFWIEDMFEALTDARIPVHKYRSLDEMKKENIISSLPIVTGSPYAWRTEAQQKVGSSPVLISIDDEKDDEEEEEDPEIEKANKEFQQAFDEHKRAFLEQKLPDSRPGKVALLMGKPVNTGRITSSGPIAGFSIVSGKKILEFPPPAKE